MKLKLKILIAAIIILSILTYTLINGIGTDSKVTYSHQDLPNIYPELVKDGLLRQITINSKEYKYKLTTIIYPAFERECVLQYLISQTNYNLLYIKPNENLYYYLQGLFKANKQKFSYNDLLSSIEKVKCTSLIIHSDNKDKINSLFEIAGRIIKYSNDKNNGVNNTIDGYIEIIVLEDLSNHTKYQMILHHGSPQYKKDVSSNIVKLQGIKYFDL